jgi:hypothetical protein
MKRLILFVIFTLIIPTISTAASKEEVREVCKKVSESAGIILAERHAGTPMVKMLESAGGQEVYEKIIIDAYERVRYPYPEEDYYQELIKDLKNEAFLECYKSYTGVE